MRADNSTFASTLESEARLRERIAAIIDEAGIGLDIGAGATPVRGSVAITQDAGA
ncbi:hypothetical protein AZ78_0117 [Lysobacter capsici AZ78]|uniref:Uncharacterized protein n=1 Tax=Lysobacter capsici AZ78 TaxID=1444315 RepID=A0A125U0B8_9GAMM|nr:hypothetical protein [Lysobacter capsici]KWS02573.1 hypothetical protein AZ78_0117 [Lysobacter capsici AZ78]